MIDNKLIVAFHNYYEELNKNGKMFFEENAGIGDNLLKPTNVLYQECLKNNIQPVILTEFENLENVDIFVFFDIPDFKNQIVQKALKLHKRNILFLCENEVVRPDQYNPQFHGFFTKIYTYRDDIVDNKKYYKFYNSLELPEFIPYNDFNNLKFSCMINSAKMPPRGSQGELYSWRLQVIDWFQKNAPNDFDLYGKGWPTNGQFPSYKGQIENKKEISSQYKFIFAYENSIHPGYLTEKVFDAFRSSTIPVVMACDNINSYIPLDCFIHLRDFPNYESLYSYLKSIDEKQYKEYIDNINKYLISDKIKPFTIDYYTNWFINELNNIPEKKYLETPNITENIPEYKYEEFENSPLCSIIIPTHNRRDELKRAIESCLNQTMKDFEVLVCNDAGYDVSDIIDSYNDSRIRYFKHETNKKVSATRNTCLKNAKGKYISFLDSDDWLLADYLKTLTDFLEHSDHKVAYCDCSRITEMKQPDGSYKNIKKELIYSHEFDPDTLLIQNIFPIESVMFERKLLEETGLFDENISTYEDWMLWIALSRFYSFAHIPKILAYYSWRIDGSTHTSGNENNEFSTLLPIVYDRFRIYCKPHIIEQQDQILELRNVKRLV